MFEGLGRKQPETPPTPPQSGLPDAAERVRTSFSTPSQVGAGFDRGSWAPQESTPRAPEQSAAQSPEGTDNVVPLRPPTDPFEAQPLDYEALGAWSRAKNSPPESRELPGHDQNDAAAAK